MKGTFRLNMFFFSSIPGNICPAYIFEFLKSAIEHKCLFVLYADVLYLCQHYLYMLSKFLKYLSNNRFTVFFNENVGYSNYYTFTKKSQS